MKKRIDAAEAAVRSRGGAAKDLGRVIMRQERYKKLEIEAAAFFPEPKGKRAETAAMQKAALRTLGWRDVEEMHEPGLKAQIRKSDGEYQRGKGRDAQSFVAALRRKSAKPKK